MSGLFSGWRRNTLLFTLLLNLALLSDGHAAVVMMYHHFGESRYPSTNIRLQQFDAQLEWLARHDYRVWPLQRVVDYLRQQRPLPDRTIALAVDDAYLSVYTEAWPRLKKRDWPFTVFVSTDYIDRQLPAYMSWQQMRELQAAGVTFANHSASHDSLVQHLPGESPASWQQRVRKDILKAQQRLEQELGTPLQLFAYPYGEYSGELARLVRELGFVAFGQQSGALDIHSDLRALPRYPMAEEFAAIDDFIVKAKSLALPVQDTVPWEPLTRERRPRLTVTLRPDGDVQISQLQCFVSGQGRVAIDWLDARRRQFRIRAATPLPAGRSRYNCTAPSVAQPQRFYWFSHPWITVSGEGQTDTPAPQ